MAWWAGDGFGIYDGMWTGNITKTSAHCLGQYSYLSSATYIDPFFTLVYSRESVELVKIDLAGRP